jgi:hypothetical protein
MHSFKIKTYDESDLRPIQFEELQRDGFEFSFIEDIVGDNFELFGQELDNKSLGNRLKEMGAVDRDAVLDCESSCFYAHFKTKKSGTAFIKKLSTYLIQKRSLLEKAKEY